MSTMHAELEFLKQARDGLRFRRENIRAPLIRLPVRHNYGAIQICFD